MYLASGMDTGDVIYTEKTEIGEYETSGELFDRLKVMGADLLVKTLRDIEAGIAPRTAQNESEASYAGQLDKAMSPIEFNRTPREIVKWIYGLQPWPVASMELSGTTVRVFSARPGNVKTGKAPGSLVSADRSGLLTACAGGETVLITEIQAPGKKRVSAGDYLLGHKIEIGD
jgi:methionyl-tRNA formyltransferase